MVGRRAEPLQETIRLLATRDLHLLLADEAGEARCEGPISIRSAIRLGLCQIDIDGPVLLRDEGLDLFFALDDHAQRDRLYPAGREAAADLFPENGADGVADQPVQHAPRLLGIDEVLVDRPGVLECLADGFGRDLVEDHALVRAVLEVGGFDEVPRDRFALAVWVSRQEDLAGGAGRFLDLLYDGALLLRNDVARLKSILNINTEPALRQVTHVPNRGPNIVLGPKNAGKRPCLGRRFDDD